MKAEVMAETSPSTDPLDSWKLHRESCRACAQARVVGDLCPIGRNFASSFMTVPPAALAVARRVEQNLAERAIARTSAGAELAIPMEKTSRAISIATSADVVLQMPERDVNIYVEMKTVIRRLIAFGDALSRFFQVSREAEEMVAEGVIEEPKTSSERALLVTQVAQHFGVPADLLYEELCGLERAVLRLGDRLGQLMRVDDETRKVVKQVRQLGLDMRELVESCTGRKLRPLAEIRQVARAARLCALELQSEIERRVGT